MKIEILYENSDFIAAYKPEGLLTIPGREGTEDSLLKILSAQAGRELYTVHRLDRPVSGAILFAKNEISHRELSLAFENRTIEKHYIALVHGVFSGFSGTINKPLREYGSGRVGVDPAEGKPSVTNYFVEERFSDFSLLDVELITGRRHQIRAHMFSIGHPIAGDLRYGLDKALQERFPRMMLHSHQIMIPLPMHKSITIKAEPPQSFKDVVTRIRTCGCY